MDCWMASRSVLGLPVSGRAMLQLLVFLTATLLEWSTHMIRFDHHFNYAEGVTRDQGDDWYLNEHVSRARELPGLVGYVSWPQVDVGIPSPGPGFPTPEDQFVRRSELRFEDLSTALAAVHGNPSLWAPSEAEVPGIRVHVLQGGTGVRPAPGHSPATLQVFELGDVVASRPADRRRTTGDLHPWRPIL